MTELAPILGAVAAAYGILAGASSLLQARRMRVSGTSAHVSFGFLASYVGGYAIWLLYGLSIGSLPVIVADGVGLVSGSVTLILAVRLRAPAALRMRPPIADGAAAHA